MVSKLCLGSLIDRWSQQDIFLCMISKNGPFKAHNATVIHRLLGIESLISLFRCNGFPGNMFTRSTMILIVRRGRLANDEERKVGVGKGTTTRTPLLLISLVIAARFTDQLLPFLLAFQQYYRHLDRSLQPCVCYDHSWALTL